MSKNNTVPTTPKVDMPSMREEKPLKKESLDEMIDSFVKGSLQSFHAILSEYGMIANDPDIDLACDKIAQSMTTLQKRSKRRRQGGVYGKN